MKYKIFKRVDRRDNIFYQCQIRIWMFWEWIKDTNGKIADFKDIKEVMKCLNEIDENEHNSLDFYYDELVKEGEIYASRQQRDK